eukprot:PhM_4_TR362/c0_g1_i1/m.16289
MTTALERNFGLYEALALPNYSSVEDVRRSYKTLALQCHPDKNLDDPENAAARFRDVSTAYQILTQPDKKEAYDRRLKDRASQTFTSGVSDVHLRRTQRRHSTGASARRSTYNPDQQELFRQQSMRREKEMRQRMEAERNAKLSEEAERVKRRQMERAREMQHRESERQREHEKLKDQLKRLQDDREKQREKNDEAMRRVMDQINRQRANTTTTTPSSGGSFRQQKRATPSSDEHDDDDEHNVQERLRLERLEQQDRQGCIECEEVVARGCIVNQRRVIVEGHRYGGYLSDLICEESVGRIYLEDEGDSWLERAIMAFDEGTSRVFEQLTQQDEQRHLYDVHQLLVGAYNQSQSIFANWSSGRTDILGDFFVGFMCISSSMFLSWQRRQIHFMTVFVQSYQQICRSWATDLEALHRRHHRTLQDVHSDRTAFLDQTVDMASDLVQTGRSEYTALFTQVVNTRVAMQAALDEHRLLAVMRRRVRAAELRQGIERSRTEARQIRDESQRQTTESKDLVMLLCKENKRLLASNAHLIEENWKISGRLRGTTDTM